MSLTALKTLIESSKATVLVAVLALLGAALFLGRINDQQFLDAIKILVPGWMAAHAVETGVKKMAEAKAVAIVESSPK